MVDRCVYVGCGLGRDHGELPSEKVMHEDSQEEGVGCCAGKRVTCPEAGKAQQLSRVSSSELSLHTLPCYTRGSLDPLVPIGNLHSEKDGWGVWVTLYGKRKC